MAELEREVRELKRANDTLKQYVSKALGLDTTPSRSRYDPSPDPAAHHGP
ncbi:transcriptional regulator, partial [Streptomyces sp. SID161]|nr:transcriptional regulator [Streptomyces sp. SID161]